jgi:MFS family permease
MVQKGAWLDPSVVLTSLGGIVALLFFIRWETRVSYPLLDLRIFHIPAFTLGNTARLLSFIIMSISNLLMPFFLQLAIGLDPLHAGFLIAPMPLAMALLAPLTGWMSERFAPERLGALGLLLNGMTFIFLAFLGADATSVQVILGLALLGVGMGLFQTPNNNLLMSTVPRHRLGVGSSVLSIVRSVGYSVGAALAAAIVTAQLTAATGQTSLQFLNDKTNIGVGSVGLEAFLRGFRFACLTAALLCFLGAAISAVRASREWRE